MKKFYTILYLFFFFVSISTYAQSNLQEKRIYLVDVTASMVGKGVEATPDIFNTVKENLVSTINHIEDYRTEIVVVPFTTKPLGLTTGTVFHKDSLTQVIRQLNINKGDTNIADAWTYGVSLIDSTKVNYIFLLTDGLHNYGPSKEDLYSRLKEWGNLSDGKNMFAFYVMLTPNAKESMICNIVDETKNLWLIESMDIDASLIKTSPVIKKNVFKDKRFSVYFDSNNPNVALKDLDLIFELENNKFYQIGQAYPSMISTTMINFDMKEIIAKKEIPLVDTLTLKISFDKEKYPFVFITPEYVNLIVANQGERKAWLSQADFEESQDTIIYFGKVKYKEPFRGPFKWARKILEPTLDYAPFSWAKPDTACTFNPIFLSFNEEAIRAKSCISFDLRDEDNNKIEAISSNLDSTIIAINEQQPITFKIKVLPGFPTGDVSGNYYVKSNNIDYFNDEQCTTGFDNMGTWHIKYKKPWPIFLWILWLVSLIISLVLIVLLIYGTYKFVEFIFLLIEELFSKIGSTISTHPKKPNFNSGKHGPSNKDMNFKFTNNWRKELSKITGWSDSIINSIRNIEEAKIYIKANLTEAIVGGRPALIRNDIDWSAYNCRKEWLKDKFAHPEKWKDYNNADLIGEGCPPRDANGDEYQLHHIGQKQNSPFAELTWDEHMGNGNNTILHQMGKESEIDRIAFDKEKEAYWENRYAMFTPEELNKIYK